MHPRPLRPHPPLSVGPSTWKQICPGNTHTPPPAAPGLSGQPPSAAGELSALRGQNGLKAAGPHRYSVFNEQPPLSIADGLDTSLLASRWRDCSGGIYLDVGSNVGVQIRKLYRPEQFPKALVLPIFEEYFGKDRRKVCSVGFEPNPKHVEYLNTVNDWLKEKGHQAVILTNVAVAAHRGTARFHHDVDAPDYANEWGASLGKVTNDTVGVETALLDLSEFYWNVVEPIIEEEAERSKDGKRPPIIMKLDIEGAEFSVVPHLLWTGALCRMSKVFIEWHEDFRTRMPEYVDMSEGELVRFLEQTQKMSPTCKVILDPLDDETYFVGQAFPLDGPPADP